MAPKLTRRVALPPTLFERDAAGPRWPQGGRKMAQDGSKMAPTWPQDGPKMSPRGGQEGLERGPKRVQIGLPRLSNIEAAKRSAQQTQTVIFTIVGAQKCDNYESFS